MDPTLLLFQSAARLLFGGDDAEERVLRAHFGVGLDVAAFVWEKFEQLELLEQGDLPIHLLWLLFWWKVYPTYDVCARFAGVSAKTFRTKVLRMQMCCALLNMVSNDN